MKNIFFLIIAICVLSGCKKEQYDLIWTQIQSPTNVDFEDVEIGDNGQIIIVGGERFDIGIAVRSSDGISWTSDSVVDKSIYDIEIINDSIVYACGFDGKLFYSNNGGNSWVKEQHGRYRPFHGLAALDNNNIIVVGGGGYDDGIFANYFINGEYFNTIDTTLIEYRSVDFVDNLTGYACGYGSIVKTEDAGQNWSPADVQGDFFMSIHFPESSTGFCVGYHGTIYKTTDSGNDWNKIRNGNNFLKKKYHMNDVFFINSMEGIIVGDNGLMLITNDGADSFKEVKGLPSDDLKAVRINNGIGYAVGENGVIIEFDSPF